MRLILAVGAAVAATTVLAYAQTEERTERTTHVFVSHGGHGGGDANEDGWLSRAESSAAADRVFAELDRNDDERLTEADRPPMEAFEVHVGGPGHAPLREGDNCERTESGEGNARRVTIICRDERGEGERRGPRVVRREGGDVIIRRHGHGDGDAAAPMPPHPPHPPRAPMMWMMLDEDSEADLNNDGAISQDEFRNQHLRMFDARDINGDGRVRAHRPPEPPTPPSPPTPPTPPGRR